MPLEMHLWRLESDRAGPVVSSALASEERLESIIAADIELLGLGPLLPLGRQVPAARLLPALMHRKSRRGAFDSCSNGRCKAEV